MRAETWRTMVSSSPAPSNGASRRTSSTDRGARERRIACPRALEQLLVHARFDLDGGRHAARLSARSSDRGSRVVSSPASTALATDGSTATSARTGTPRTSSTSRAPSARPGSLTRITPDGRSWRGERTAHARRSTVVRRAARSKPRRLPSAPRERARPHSRRRRCVRHRGGSRPARRRVRPPRRPPRLAATSARPGAASTSMRLSASTGTVAAGVEPIGEARPVGFGQAQDARRVTGEVGEQRAR